MFHKREKERERSTFFILLLPQQFILAEGRHFDYIAFSFIQPHMQPYVIYSLNQHLMCGSVQWWILGVFLKKISGPNFVKGHGGFKGGGRLFSSSFFGGAFL
jgi:hypothetical protein